MCTAITYTTKDHYFGRNFDYEISYKEVVTIVPRNYRLEFRKVPNLDTHYAMIGIAAGIVDYPLYYRCNKRKRVKYGRVKFCWLCGL
ncbi:linear amide C-N hydrolase [Enterococcus gallinarum]|nr:linear amide C-N hydrolase [Enterococcus gallinarum]